MSALAPFLSAEKLFERDRWARVADAVAVAVAVSLPWSTSATSALIALWVVTLLPTLRLADLARELKDPAAGLPVLLWALGIVGMLWSAASLTEQFYALKGFHKVLVIPLLFVHFRRSERGHWVIGGFLASCTVLLAASWVLHVWGPPPSRYGPGVPVKDYIVQSAEFLICAFAAGHLAVDAWLKQQRAVASAMAALALLFLANIAFVAAGRTSLAAFPVLLILFAVQRFGVRGALGLVIGGALFAAVIWVSSPYLRERAFGVADEIQRYHSTNAETSTGYRLEFWKKSVVFVAEAPVLGHGTGSIPDLFRRAATGDTGIAAAVTGNPHNQTLEIAIQFGLVGTALLYAMWIAHLLMFRGTGLAAWLGQGVVTQTIVGALFLSYLLDFSSGWLYVFGVGVLGGMCASTQPQAKDAPLAH
ncbi:MAG: O-antigen ligase family protein [Xanthobacteraceae bacterium]